MLLIPHVLSRALNSSLCEKSEEHRSRLRVCGASLPSPQPLAPLSKRLTKSMTTAPTMYMETVSLNDDAPPQTATQPTSTVLDVDSLEAQFTQPSVAKQAKDASPEMALPVTDSDSDEDQNKDENALPNGASSPNNRKSSEDAVVVDVDEGHRDAPPSSDYSSQNGNQQHHVLPPLRVLTQKIPIEERDYVDTSLFSPEVSRHAMEVAHRRAKAIANEVKEMIELDHELGSSAKAKMTPSEAVGIISGAFAHSLKKAKKIVKPGTKEYDLLSGSSPSAGMSKLDDLDTDGDGLQLSPDASNGDGKYWTPKMRPALKRISAYSSTALEPEKKTSSMKHQKKKGIQWHEDVLDADEEFYHDDNDEQETHALMDTDGSGNGNGSPRPQILNYSSKNDGQLTPRSKKKRKKLVRSMMRRLTPREKEELYRQRPDLMIVPNWAQKYREELAGEDSTRWSAWLLFLITALAVLLIVFILLIVRQRAAAS